MTPTNTGWRPIADAPKDGTLCALRFRDRLGYYQVPGPFFLHDDGFWYLVNPPTKTAGNPTHWQPIEPPETDE